MRDCGECTGTGVIFNLPFVKGKEFTVCSECAAYYRSLNMKNRKLDLENSRDVILNDAALQWKLDYPTEESFERATRVK